MPTLRKKIAEVLEEDALDLREISKLFRIKEKEALDHLKHIEKSLHPRRLTAEPASCRQCGFSFKKRTRLNTPGRCPVCKSEHISPPRFKINPSSEARRPGETLGSIEPSGQQDSEERPNHPPEESD